MLLGGGVGVGCFIGIPRALSSCDYMLKKKSLLLSVCKGNGNLMRHDFFFSIHSHLTLCFTTGSLRRGTQDEMLKPFSTKCVDG